MPRMKQIALVLLMIASSSFGQSPSTQPVEAKLKMLQADNVRLSAENARVRAENAMLRTELKNLESDFNQLKIELAKLHPADSANATPATQPTTPASKKLRHFFDNAVGMTLDEAENATGGKARLIEGDSIRSIYRLHFEDRSMNILGLTVTVRASDGRITSMNIID